MGGIKIKAKRKKKIINSPYGPIELVVTNYTDNSRLAILTTIHNRLFQYVTIDIPDYKITDIDKGFIYAKTDSAGEYGFNLIEQLKKRGIIEETYEKCFYKCGDYYGYHEYAKFNLEKLKKYDSDGVNRYLEMTKNIDSLELKI